MRNPRRAVVIKKVIAGGVRPRLQVQHCQNYGILFLLVYRIWINRSVRCWQRGVAQPLQPLLCVSFCCDHSGVLDSGPLHPARGPSCVRRTAYDSRERGRRRLLGKLLSRGSHRRCFGGALERRSGRGLLVRDSHWQTVL